jgi:hypothetical protein
MILLLLFVKLVATDGVKTNDTEAYVFLLCHIILVIHHHLQEFNIVNFIHSTQAWKQITPKIQVY